MKHLLLLCAVFVQLHLSAKQDQLMFVENQGQWNNDIFFASINNEADVLLLEDGLVFHLKDLSKVSNHHIEAEQIETPIPSYAYKMEFIGNNNVKPEVKESCETVFNFFIGNKEEKWRTQVPSARKVLYQNFYDNIDLLVYSANGRLKYDFILHPNADPELIRWRYQFADGSIDQDGKLNIKAGDFEVEEGVPFTYQREESKITEVKCEYQCVDGVFSFEMDDYDPSRKTIIDPEIVWSTYSDIGRLNFYSAVNELKQTLFGARAFYSTDIFNALLLGSEPNDTWIVWPLNCLSEDGSSLLWTTIIGGTEGNSSAFNLYISPNGNLALSGFSSSYDFPIPLGAFSNQNGSIILELNSDASSILSGTSLNFGDNLLWDSYLLSFNSYADEKRSRIFIKKSNNTWIVSFRANQSIPSEFVTNTYGSNFNYPAIIVCLNSDFTELQWLTQIGADNDCSCEKPWFVGCSYQLLDCDILTDSFLLVGSTYCEIPMSNPEGFDTVKDEGNEGFIIGVNLNSGELNYSSYLGHTGMDEITVVKTTSDGVWFAGRTTSSFNFTSDYSFGNNSTFYLKLDPTLQQMVHFFTLGQTNVDSNNSIITPSFIAIDSCGNVISGIEQAQFLSPFVTENYSGLPVIGGFRESGISYFFRYSIFSQSIEESTFFGAGSIHNTADIELIDNSLRFAMCSHYYNEPNDFEYTYVNPTPQAYLSLDSANFEPTITNITNLRFNNLPSGFVTAQANAEPVSVACGENVFDFSSNGTAQTYLWDFGNGDTLLSPEANIQYTFDEPGNYVINYTAIDSSTCNVSDSHSFEINIEPSFSELQFDWETPSAVEPCIYPQELSFQYTGSGEDLVLWTLPSGEELSNLDDLDFLIEAPGSYSFSIQATDLVCDSSVVQSVNFEFYEPLSLQTNIDVTESEQLCNQAIVNFDLDASGYNRFQWYWNEQLISEEPGFSYQLPPGLQNIELQAQSDGCEQDSVLELQVNIPPKNSAHELFIPNVFTPNSLGLNEQFKIVFPHDYSLIKNFEISISNRWGQVIFASNDPQFRWDGTNISKGEHAAEGTYFYTLKYQLSCSEELFTNAGEVSLLR